MMVEMPSRLLPTLRFPEFRKEPGWERMKLRTVLKEHGLKSDGSSEVSSVSLAKGIVPQIEHMGRSYAASDTSHYNLVRPYDIVYTRSPLALYKLGIVKQHKAPTNVIVSPLYGVFTAKTRYLGQLIEAYFDSPSRSLQFLEPLAQKGAKNTIQLSNERFLSGSLFLPREEAEQEKIANCLGSLENLITVGGRKLKALQQHKAGLIQQLFPRTGATVPQLRFPMFADAPEWEVKTLGDMGEFLPSLTGKTAADFDSGDAHFVPYVNVYANTFTDINALRRVNVTEDESQNAVRRGDVFFTVSSETKEDAGMASVLRDDIANCYLNSFCAMFRFHDDVELALDFVGYALRSVSVREYLAVNAQGSTRFNIGKNVFRELSVCVPSRDEQLAIAECLVSIDEQIAGQIAWVEALGHHKQGLLQQLFPSREI